MRHIHTQPIKIFSLLTIIIVIIISSIIISSLFLTPPLQQNREPGTDNTAPGQSAIYGAFYGVTTTGSDVLISDMRELHLLPGGVYSGDIQLTNIKLRVYTSFVMPDDVQSVTVTSHIRLQDWTAYELQQGGPSHDKFDLPFSLFSFELLPPTTTPGGSWCAVYSVTHSPTTPTSSQPVTVTVKFAYGDWLDSNIQISHGDDSPLGTGVLTAQYRYASQTTSSGWLSMSITGTTGTFTVPAQPDGSVVSVGILADYNGATAYYDFQYNVNDPTPEPPPTTVYHYYTGRYAADYGYSEYQYGADVMKTFNTNIGNMLHVGDIYLLSHSSDPCIIPPSYATDIDVWFTKFWWHIWSDSGQTELPENAIVRLYMRSYIDISVNSDSTPIAQSPWTSTFGITLGNTPGTTLNMYTASCFGVSGTTGISVSLILVSVAAVIIALPVTELLGVRILSSVTRRRRR